MTTTESLAKLPIVGTPKPRFFVLHKRDRRCSQSPFPDKILAPRGMFLQMVCHEVVRRCIEVSGTIPPHPLPPPRYDANQPV